MKDALAAPVRRFTADALTVEVYADQQQMAAAAALAARDCLRIALSRQAGAAVILASANSQIQFLDALTAAADVEWGRLTLFHMDEYLGISGDHPASFRRFLREHVERRVRPGRIHYVEGDTPLPLDECARYGGLLAAQPVDLCCLGIGENGHIAFNDPPVARFDDPFPVKLAKLDEACRRQQVGEGHYPSLDAVPQYAFTLTIPRLCAANRMLCIVPEQRKAEAVRNALKGPITTACPASILRQQPQATLYLDADSASLL